MSFPGGTSPAVRNGLRRMLERRSALLAEGGRAIGWKLAFGSPAWLERFGLTGPLVGYLPESKSRRSGATVSCRGWVNPVAEPEVAVYMGRDVEDPEHAAACVSEVGPAIELADVDTPPEDIESVLADNVFHRAVILGEPGPGAVGAGLEGMHARITVDGSPMADTDDLEALTGPVPEILAHAAALLGGAGEQIRSGDVIILGSVVPPLTVQPGSRVDFELEPMGSVSVRV